MVTICVDAVGGDEPAEVVLQGIAAALAEDSDLCVLVAGPAEVVEPFCAEHDRATALVASEVIGMDEHPTEAVRKKKDSSIVRGCEAVRKGAADGFFSAGSTGAIFAAAAQGVGRIKGIKRPALASAVPATTGGKTVFMDMGANADARPEMIVQFAQMGRAYAHVVLGVADPKVALLSNGEEETKGSAAVLEQHAALKEAGPWFVGNCEGTDVLEGRFDVIVSDGFTGNVALKMLEGTAKFIMARAKQAAKSSKRAAIGALLLKPALKAVAAELSGDEMGGAILIGLKAPVFIGHGATSVDAVKHGTLACAAAVRGDLCGKIAEEIVAAA